jgi:predicted transcriptional regulator of viral defense system
MLLDFSMLKSGSKVRLGKVAGRQWGRVTWAQIQELGIPEGTASLWLADGYLHPRLPRVYAVGHPATCTESDLAEALLYAGPGAALSHATAAWWLGLLDDRPHTVHVSTPRQPRSLPRIRVHRRRACERAWHNGLPTTTLPQTVVDFSTKAPLWAVRRALAKMDYAGTLDLEAIDAVLGRGRPGSARLRLALERHRPDLAATKSRLEAMFFEICEREGWPLPEVNQYIAGWEVDALWRDERVAVELDGYGNHHTPAQLRRDRAKEMDLRRAGWTPVRYSEEQLESRDGVIADLRRLRDGP